MAHVAYFRVSTKRQGKSGLGLESQKAIVRHYHDDIVAEFVEVVSGKSTGNRPKLQQAIELCRDEGYTLVVAKVDRLSRNTEDTLRIYRRLDGRLRSCDLPMTNGDESGFKFALTLFAAIAERERELASIRTREGIAAKRIREPDWQPGNPENLTIDPKLQAQAKRQAAIDAYRTTAGYVKMLKEQGLSYNHIADRLNDEGFKTRQDKPFQAMTVYRILKRVAAAA